MPSQPLLSIVVPVYNVEKYLKRCVDSIIRQSYSNKEIILVDDGSTDNSGRLCDRYTELYSEIVVVHKQNGGLSSARNAGMNIAKGDFVTFIDSDDAYGDSQTLEISMNYLINDEEIDIVQFPLSFVHLDSTGAECERNIISSSSIKTISDKNEFVEQLGHWICFNKSYLQTSVCNKIFRVSCLKNVNFTNIFIEDAYFLLDLSITSPQVLIHDRGMYEYIQRENSILNSKRTLNKILDLIKLFSKLYESLRLNSNDYRLHRHCILVIDSLLQELYVNYGKHEFAQAIENLPSVPLKLSKRSGSFVQRLKLFLVSLFGFKNYATLFCYINHRLLPKKEISE